VLGFAEYNYEMYFFGIGMQMEHYIPPPNLMQSAAYVEMPTRKWKEM
jgi:hypothetical protein